MFLRNGVMVSLQNLDPILINKLFLNLTCMKSTNSENFTFNEKNLPRNFYQNMFFARVVML